MNASRVSVLFVLTVVSLIGMFLPFASPIAHASGGTRLLLFIVNAGATLNLSNVTIAEGYNSIYDGGAIQNMGTLNIANGKFVSNVAVDGCGRVVIDATRRCRRPQQRLAPQEERCSFVICSPTI